MKKLLLLFSLSLLVSMLVIGSCTKKENAQATTAKVTFDANGGKFTSHGSVQTIDTIVKIGDYVPYPAKPTRPNYVFKGWCEDKECKILWSWLTKVEKDITLYAKWEDDGGGGGGGGGKKKLKVETDTVSVTETTAMIWGSVKIAAGVEVSDTFGIVYVDPEGAPHECTLSEGSELTYFYSEITNLPPSTVYTYYAYAVDANGNKVKSTEKSFTTKSGPVYPEAPTLESVYINGIWWAPVNCGYTDTTKYGLLYQFGRKVGSTYGPESSSTSYAEEGYQASRQAWWKDNYNKAPAADTFYFNTSTPFDWYTNNKAKQLSEWPITDPEGTADIGNPCPSGWRVPTYDELYALLGSHKSGDLQDGTGVYIGMRGKWFDGSAASEPSSGVFLPAAGWRSSGSDGKVSCRGSYGYYWSSSINGLSAYALRSYGNFAGMGALNRAFGYPVRCVKE